MRRRRRWGRWWRERVAQANMSECVPVYICLKAIAVILVVPPCPKRKCVWVCEPVSAIYSICFCIFRFVFVWVCGWISLTNFYVKNCKMFLVFGQWARNHNTNVGIHIWWEGEKERKRERWVIRKMVIGGKVSVLLQWVFRYCGWRLAGNTESIGSGKHGIILRMGGLSTSHFFKINAPPNRNGEWV